MTLTEAIVEANRLAKKMKRNYYVIMEYPDDNDYLVVSDYEMDTYFSGMDFRISYAADKW